MVTSRGLVLSGLIDIRDRYLRVLAGVSDLMAATDPGTRSVLAALRERLQETLREYNDSLVGQIVAAEIAGSDDPETWQSRYVARMVSTSVTYFNRLAGLHEQLQRHVAALARQRQDLAYLLFRSLDLSLMSPTHARTISVHLSQNVAWEANQYELRDGGVVTAVSVPWMETLGPMRWPIVVHELGHFMLPGQLDGLARVEEFAREQAWDAAQQRAFEEIVADAVGQRHFGDAYSFALAREAFLLSYRRHAVSAVSVARRLTLLGAPADLLGALPEEWNLHERAVLEADTQDASEPVESEPAATNADTLAMRAAAVELVGAGVGNDLDAVTAARRLLAVGEPAAVKSLDVVYSIFRVDVGLVGQAAASSSGVWSVVVSGGTVVRDRVRTSRPR